MIYTEAGDPDNAFCRSDNSDVLDTTPWIRVPYPGQWGAPTFKCVYNRTAAAMLGLAARAVCFSISTSVLDCDWAFPRRKGASTVLPNCQADWHCENRVCSCDSLCRIGQILSSMCKSFAWHYDSSHAVQHVVRLCHVRGRSRRHDRVGR